MLEGNGNAPSAGTLRGDGAALVLPLLSWLNDGSDVARFTGIQIVQIEREREKKRGREEEINEVTRIILINICIVTPTKLPTSLVLAALCLQHQKKAHYPANSGP